MASLTQAESERLIFEWCNHIPVPKWKAKTAYKECFHCGDSFSGGHQHNCRLCGELLCSLCTTKYQLPGMFAGPKKHKADEAVRVCYGCKLSCMAEKKRVQEEKESKATAGSIAVPSKRGAAKAKADEKAIYPPVWKDMAGFVACYKCHKKGGKPHNCRTCGELLCDNCTGKMAVPPAFEKKKGKDGPARVCDECRFKLKGGYRLVESKEEKKAAGPVVDDDIPPPDDAPPEEGLSISVKKEGEVKAYGAIVVRETATLVEIDTKFKAKGFAPAGITFEYLVRGQPVHKVFWDIFTARIIGNVLYIRPALSREEQRKKDAESGVGFSISGPPMMMMAPQTVEAVPTTGNPFKLKQEAKKPPEPKKPPVVFKTPKGARKAAARAFATQSAAALRAGPPPAGLGTGLPTGPVLPEEEKKEAAPAAAASGDPFKSRAAQFKAMPTIS